MIIYEIFYINFLKIIESIKENIYNTVTIEPLLLMALFFDEQIQKNKILFLSAKDNGDVDHGTYPM